MLAGSRSADVHARPVLLQDRRPQMADPVGICDADTRLAVHVWPVGTT